MKLRAPIDILILQVLSTGENANPVRARHMIERDHGDQISDHVGELWSLDYVTQRMSTLRGFELLERVPPEDSSLYRITPLGYAALDRVIDTGSTEFSFRELVAVLEELALVAELLAIALDVVDRDHVVAYNRTEGTD